MKKKLLLGVMLFACSSILMSKTADASKKDLLTKDPGCFSTAMFQQQVFAKPFLQYVGHVQDPLNPNVYYQLYGSSNHIASVNVVNPAGVPTGATASVVGVYSLIGGAVYYSSGTITRSNNTTFNFSVTEDIS